MEVDTKGAPLWKYMLLEHGVSIVRGGDGTDPNPTQQQAFSTGQGDAPTGGVTVIDPPTPPTQQQQAATPGGGDPLADPLVQAAINRARQEEKDKLYETIGELRTSVQATNEREQSRLDAEKAEREAAAEVARLAQEAEMDAKQLLAQRDSEWNERFESMNQQIAQSNAVLEQERRRNELVEYRASVLDMATADGRSVRDQIHPTLIDFVRGDTPQEIEAAAQDMISRSAAIMNDVREVMQQQRMQSPMSSVTQTPGPEAAIQGQRTLTPQEIQALPMAEYEKLRPQLLAASGQQFRGAR